MCNFLSAVYTRNGKLICEPAFTPSHSTLLDSVGLQERKTTAPVQQFVKLELLPVGDSSKFFQFNKWEEHVDEKEVPAWFDDAARFDAFSKMREILEAAVVEESTGTYFGKLILLKSGDIQVFGGLVYAFGRSCVQGGNFISHAFDIAKISGIPQLVYFHDSSTGTLFGSAMGQTRDESSVDLHQQAQAFAYNNSDVVANEQSRAWSYDKSCVTLYGDATCQAGDNSLVMNFTQKDRSVEIRCGAKCLYIDSREWRDRNFLRAKAREKWYCK